MGKGIVDSRPVKTLYPWKCPWCGGVNYSERSAVRACGWCHREVNDDVLVAANIEKEG